jgi:hypothetical protein
MKLTINQALKQLNTCEVDELISPRLLRCACPDTTVTVPLIVEYWPHHLACDNTPPPMDETLVELLKQRRSELRRYREEDRVVSTLDMIDFMLFDDDRIRKGGYKGVCKKTNS